MRSVGRQNTGPELIVRKIAHSLGLRFRLHKKGLIGSPDIVFSSRKVAVFVNGCFWHRHKGCKKASSPKTNKPFWETKFKANVSRDRLTYRKLKALGWKVMVIWECETKRDVSKILSLFKEVRKIKPK